MGPHAESLLQWATTRDIAKLYPGKSVYASMLDEDGKFVDDCIVYRTGPNAFMVVHGAGTGHEMLVRSALGRQVAVLFDDDLHDLSLQGPLAVDFLAEHVPGVRQLPYFHHLQTRLFERPVMISRTGYTGERGYEIFCKAADAPFLWDSILEQGASLGIIPCAFTALDWLRVESSLMFFSPMTTRRCTPSLTRRPATPCGKWAWISPSRPANKPSVAPRNTCACAVRSVSRSPVCCSRAYARPRPATPCGRATSKSA
nr:hypothetical protein GCM10020185_85700 [Pseudomonas brassicacearum subsp. brassicacearum]